VIPKLQRFSRYHTTKLLVDEAGNTRFIEWKPPFYGERDELLYTVDGRDINRPDLISYRVYGTSDLWWYILNYNTIHDPFSLVVGQKLKIPDINDQVIGSGIGSITDIESDATYSVSRLPTITILPHKRPSSQVRDSLPLVNITEPFLFNFGLPVPAGLSGNVHFQIQVSDNAEFSNINMSVMTQTSTDRWFYYSPAAHSGAGGFVAFPSTGIDGQIYQSQTVYFHFIEKDPITVGSEYYFRYRAWVDNIEGPWFASPPLILS
jgi:hypothetical protein